MIGVLYESGEWSDYKLAAELAEAGLEVKMVDLALGEARDERAAAVAAGEALACDVLVSRIFASAVFRGHGYVHQRMRELLVVAERKGIPLINPAPAHFYEIDKKRAVEDLARVGVDAPCVQALGKPRALLACLEEGAAAPTLAERAARGASKELGTTGWSFPCIIKPNCGGRTTFTCLAHSKEEARAFLAEAPDLEFIVEEYVEPERGFVTRVELVDGVCALIVKRSVVAGGLSAYHLGSTYALYPDCPERVRAAAERAGRALSIAFGSFDIIENGGRAWVIDANSVSNVSPDNTATFGGFDLMREYAQAIARKLQNGRGK